jgi:hypothetical protein
VERAFPQGAEQAADKGLRLAEVPEEVTAGAEARIDSIALAAPFGRLRAGFEVVPLLQSGVLPQPVKPEFMLRPMRHG